MSWGGWLFDDKEFRKKISETFFLSEYIVELATGQLNLNNIRFILSRKSDYDVYK